MVKKLSTLLCAAAVCIASQAQDFTKVLMVGIPTEAQMKTAAPAADDDEVAAYKWLTSHPGAHYACAAEVIANPAMLYDYKVVWVAVDRQGIGQGSTNLPAPMADGAMTNALRTYARNGGNLLLTNHAAQIATAIGRIDREVNIFSSGAGDIGTDNWTVQNVYGVNMSAKLSRADHPIYAGIATCSEFEWPTIPLMGSGNGSELWRENHNCFWVPADLGFGANNSADNITSFEATYSCRALGTWGQVEDYCGAGIIDFNPTSVYKGRIITIGLAAYEWNANQGTNAHHDNIERMTQNALSYLISNGGNPDPNGDPGTDPTQSGTLLAHYDMDMNGRSICERISGVMGSLHGRYAEAMPGAVEGGSALRLDAYSSFVEAPGFDFADVSAATISLWCAAETYPMGSIDVEDEGWGWIAGCERDSRGWLWEVSSRGAYRFAVSINGQLVTVTANERMPKYEWCHLVAAIDARAGVIKIYRNGKLVGQSACPVGNLTFGNASMIIGKSRNSAEYCGCLINAFNGLIDDITISTGIDDVAEINAQTPANDADVVVSPSRYEGNILRPQLHAAPAANWGNETHGLYYDQATGKYHMFYQKNGNGCYLSHMHWGHLVSTDMVNWREVKTAVAPSESYDWKGCWSGCLFQDEGYNNGRPTIFYTGVNNADPSIVEALPLDEDLLDWEKRPTGISRPASGYDFRDPYVFKYRDNYYMIIGCSNNGHGATRLHVYDKNRNAWDAAPSLFFESTGAGSLPQGAFWEMPTLTEIDGLWLMTIVTCALEDVRAIYWVGRLEGEGANLRFVPSQAEPRSIEMSGLAGFGYGMLSPSLASVDGKLLALGIVPDKLTAAVNCDNGWSHNYSLPREWTLSGGELVQLPYSGLSALRSKNNAVEKTSDFNSAVYDLPGTRMMEMDLELDANSRGSYTLQFFKGSSSYAEITLDMASNRLSVNTSQLNRIGFDTGRFNNGWSTDLPARANGTARLNVFIDHSTVDIFVNNRYASSVRVYPRNAGDTEARLLVNGGNADIRSLSAYALDPTQMPGNPTVGIENVSVNDDKADPEYYTTTGIRVSQPTGGNIYIVRCGTKVTKVLYRD